MQKITMLGTGLIGMFYTRSLHAQRSRDQVQVVCSKTEAHASKFAQEHHIPRWTTSFEDAINDPETDIVVVGLPNNLHLEAVQLAAKAGKAVLITKPLGRNASKALTMLKTVESSGSFGGYLEDLVFTPASPFLFCLPQVVGFRMLSQFFIGRPPRWACR